MAYNTRFFVVSLPFKTSTQEELSIYLGFFFEFVHNVMRRKSDLLNSLMDIFCNLKYDLKLNMNPDFYYE